ncbi:MAG: dephospho-CoA kinase [Clostridia bacterium]|nr:dephospho-CoA kinase [Clostridia bacterium]
MIVGLTGGIACGKSTVAQMLQECGAFIVDADAISRSLTAPGGAGLAPVRQAFGDAVFAPDGTLDRAALAKIVFASDEKRAQLNAVLHPLIRQEMLDQTALGQKQGAKVVVLDVPLLFEAGMQDMADLTVCVYAPQQVQIDRMASRNGYTREEALSRILSQMPVDEKRRLSDFDLNTDQPLDRLRLEVRRLYDSWA